MPIYAYKCESCGLAKDVLQKMSEDPLSVCPACGKATFQKQLTAAGFQLKGSGWYATDFKGGSQPAPAADSKPDAASEAKADTKSDTQSDAAPASSPAPAAPAPSTP